MATILRFGNAGYAPLIVRILETGEKYGRANALTADRPLVEFFDPRYPFDEISTGLMGQFIGRYRLDTIKSHGSRPLSLDGGVPSWTANNQTMTALWVILSHLVVT